MSSRTVARDLLRRLGCAAILAAIAPAAGAQQQVWRVDGNAAQDELGTSVTFVPDVDGDGVVDFLAGQQGYFEKIRRVRLYSGATGATLREFDDTSGDAFGQVVTDLGDVDGDGLRDFAIGAPPSRVVVVSGAGPVLRTFTRAAATNLLGDELTYVGDVDGDGVRDLLFRELTSTGPVVTLASGATGATIRTHSSASPGFGTPLGRVGDVDGDGVDDYALGDPPNVRVYSGASGSQLFAYASAAGFVGAAGDLDLDGHAEVAIADFFKVHVVSGATGALMFDLDEPNHVPWTAVSATADRDGDGHPDVVVATREFNHDNLYFFSGATGKQLAKYSDVVHSDVAPIESIDATADQDADGTFDVLVGCPVTSGATALAGEVDVISGANGSKLQTVVGSVFFGRLGSSVALVSDRDGDGWRDVAVAVPGGFDQGQTNRVVVLSGRDGHELSRFTTASDLSLDPHALVSVGDLNGDGKVELAVLCSGANVVEIHSGSDDSLLSTLTLPSGVANDLAAAADVNGTPLLAVAADVPQTVFVYDLTTNAVVTTWSGHGARMVACVGDVDGDGFVDWVVHDPRNNGVAQLFSGGPSPKSIWKVVGTPTNPVDGVASTGDLDGDGHDDVLVANVGDNQFTGKVSAYSGANAKKIFEIKGTETHGKFGDRLATLGDVNGDGVCDFAIGSSGFVDNDDSTAYGGAVFVYSGATTSLLYRFDGGNTGQLDVAAIANDRWHDDSRVDGDRAADLVVGNPHSDVLGEVDSGFVELHRLDDVLLQFDPNTVYVGTTVTVTTRGGPVGSPVGLYAIDVSGTPLGYFFAIGTFNSKGNFLVTDVVPPSMQGLTLDVISYAIGFNGKLVDSEETAIEVQ